MVRCGYEAGYQSCVNCIAGCIVYATSCHKHSFFLLATPQSPSSSRKHLSYDGCLGDKGEYYQNCSVSHCVGLLCTVMHSLFVSELTSLESRRDQLSRSFFQDITHPSSSLYHLLPLHVIRLSCLGSERPHGLHVLSHAPKNIAPLLTKP